MLQTRARKYTRFWGLMIWMVLGFVRRRSAEKKGVVGEEMR